MEFLSLYEAVMSNPIAITMFSGFVLYLCKDLPVKLYNFLLDSLTTNVTIYQDGNFEAYESIEYLLNDSKIHYIQGRFQLIYRWIHKKLEMACDENAIYLVKLDGLWAIVTKRTDTQVQFWRLFSYQIRFLSRNKEKIESFLQKTYRYQISLSDSDETRIYHYIAGNWTYSLKKKCDCSLFLDDQKEQVIKKISYFLNNEEEYHSKNKPYKEGIILYGEPGCGKSFFISQLASMFDLNIYYMNLNNFTNESDFLKAIISINNPSILLIEDIDCSENLKQRDKKKKDVREKVKNDIKEEKKNDQNTGLTLSTVLNVLDGILSQEGQITIITTNYIDKLDSALIRSGRFDSKVEFKKLEAKCVKAYIEKWYNVKEVKIDSSIKASIADLANICSKNQSVEACLQDLQKLTSTQK